MSKVKEVTGLDWDDFTAFDVQNKGWYEQVKVELEDGTLLTLSFWDPVRLGQELQQQFDQGSNFFAERNLIVLPVLNEKAIRQTIDELSTKGFFERS